jgi:hypothetical protein
VVALVAWQFWSRWRFLDSSPYPFGVDGYYYAIQLRSLLENGQMHYPATPLVMWWMLPFAWVAGPIAGAKLGAALGTALLPAPVYVLGRRIGGRWETGLLAAVLAATSAEGFYHSLEFIKQGIGLTLVATCLVAVLWALDAPTRRRIAVAVAAVLAAALAHKTAAVIAVVASVPPVYAAARARGWQPGLRDRATRLAIAGGAALLVIALALAVVAPDRFVSADDIEPVRGLFTTSAEWTVPVLNAGKYPLRFGHEAAIAGVVALAAAALLVLWRVRRAPELPQRPAHDRAVIIAPVALAIFAALPWIDVTDPEGLGFRLRLMAFLPLVIAAAFVAGVLLRRLPRPVPGALVAGFLVGWILSRPATSREGLVDVDPDMRAAILAAQDVVPEGDWIICPQRSLMFMATYETRAQVRLRPETIAPERRWRLMPSRFLHEHVVRAMKLLREQRPAGVPLPRGLHPRNEDAVVLMPEVTWEWLMKQIPPWLRKQYDGWRTR